MIVTGSDAFDDRGKLRLTKRSTSSGRISVYAFPSVEVPLAAAGGSLESAPEGDFTRCEVKLPVGAFEGVREIYLSVKYEGGVGNAFIDGELIADDFSNGQLWEIASIQSVTAIAERDVLIAAVSPRGLLPRRSGAR